MSASPLLAELRQAKNALEDAQIAHCGAVTAFSEAKQALLVAEAQIVCDGLEGKNEKERNARLRLALESEYVALAAAESALNEARCSVHVARLEWEFAYCRLNLPQQDCGLIAA